LVGSISSYAGVEKDLAPLLQSADLGGEWADFLSPTNLALCGAACHNLYPLLAGSSIPFEGLLYEIQASCFRHEPSDDPARMQSFSMREFVYLGTENGAIEHRDSWLRRGRDILLNLGLAVEVVAANDPFFGRGGKLLGAAQLEKVLKFEIVTPISSESPGAIGSGNYHESHFGDSFHLSLPDGSVAHTACIGFGLERTTLALLYTHGLNAELWPKEVRQRLLFSQNDREAD
jgi:seryl-tRNA synthetase